MSRAALSYEKIDKVKLEVMMKVRWGFVGVNFAEGIIALDLRRGFLDLVWNSPC